jgi:hypothetical protein
VLWSSIALAFIIALWQKGPLFPMGNLMTKRPFVDPNLKAQRSGQLFPLELSFKVPEALFGGGDQKLTLNSGLTTFVGPNGAGKTRVMRALKEPLKQATGIIIARFLVAGRSAPLELYRGALEIPGNFKGGSAAVGSIVHKSNRWGLESFTGDLMALKERADLLVKIEARLQLLFRIRLHLDWTQGGIQLNFTSNNGNLYSVNTEASGVLHLVGLLAALYDDDVAALLIDEPEISLHPQYQAFLLEEIRQVAACHLSILKEGC